MTVDEQVAGEDRVLTLPNLITAIRLSLIPVFAIWVSKPERRADAAWLLAGLGSTDWVDGYLARRLQQVSTVGKVLDPVADRLLIITAGVAVIATDSMPVWFAAIVLTREVLISVGTIALAAMGARRIDVQRVGKAGAFGVMVSLPLFLASTSTLSWADQAEIGAWIWGVPGAVLSWISLIGYVGLARAALTERSASAVPAGG